MRRTLFIIVVWALATAVAKAQEAGASGPSFDAKFGKGASFNAADGAFTLQLRARAQLRYSATHDDESGETANEFVVRRMRLLLKGTILGPKLEYYLQLGFATSDMESDLRVPLRDAYLTWSPLRDLSVRVGQMKVPYALQRRVSSGSLQFPDRTAVMSELNLDRDTGLVLFSNDLFGLDSLFGYQLGVFGGDGRNRSFADAGVLVVGRLQFKPLGKFDELVECDLERLGAPRLMVGGGVAFNSGTRRSQSTIGAAFEEARFDYLHANADASFKWRGVSLQAEWLYRKADRNESTFDLGDGSSLTERSRSAWGAYIQAGYAFPEGLELAGRYGTLHPLDDGAENAADLRKQELAAAFNWYPRGHDLKVQADLSRLGGAGLSDDGETRLRVQTQFWF